MRHIESQYIQDAHKKCAEDVEEPEAERYLSRGEEGKANVCRNKEQLQLVEAGKEPIFREILSGKYDHWQLRNGRIMVAQSINHVDKYWNTNAPEQEFIGQKFPHCTGV